MSLLECENIDFGYQDQRLFEGANMRFFEAEHTVLVGPNGSGKSTFLKLLNQELKPDRGVIQWQNNKRIGYLDQYKNLDQAQLVKTYLYEVYQDLFDQEERMEHLYIESAHLNPKAAQNAMQKAANIGEMLADNGFYEIKANVGKILTGLGLSTDLLESPIKHLSEGMRAKIILSKLLLEEADVLLLDEPTNFLDVKHIEWLIKFLNGYPKAFIVVSHHVEFLKAIAQTVFAIENKEITRYKGDFNYYLTERKLRFQQQKKAFHKQQAFIEKTEDFIQKNITRAKTSKRAQSRRKMLKKLKRVDRPKTSKTYHFNFPFSKATGREVLKLNELEIGYQDSLVEPLSLMVRKEDKVVITGKNGIGKSTLVKTILNELDPIAGSYHWIDTAEIAYFAQESHLDSEMIPFDVIHAYYPHFTRKDVMDLLAQHGIDYAMAHRPLKTLSGGENAKVRLALLKYEKGNVLILDEPTNHLDYHAKKALKNALIDYRGTMILVSHEKSFYQDICDYEIELFAE